ncbi:hypothetical protein K432DRAFT_235327 [Lepidopterella palustris CBS 459.81]|uniref:Uncharacterized protein n=1 Tax=Lepidopterella palustris CBS 459.81 TaxID=1314670 RepID=A0A8E2JH12_9PEZI|nr:hypothetical protein K432DRAFT_235327 [Lepidopterella palustris CBS 459.81]
MTNTSTKTYTLVAGIYIHSQVQYCSIFALSSCVFGDRKDVDGNLEMASANKNESQTWQYHS